MVFLSIKMLVGLAHYIPLFVSMFSELFECLAAVIVCTDAIPFREKKYLSIIFH
jgi:hypothetical protein